MAIRLIYPKLMTLIAGVIFSAAIGFGVYEEVIRIRAERAQHLVERCPDFSNIEHWYGTYDESFWKPFFGNHTEHKISEWIRGDYIAFGALELSAIPLPKKELTLAWVRLAITATLDDSSHRTPFEFKSREFTCWRGVRYDGEFVIIHQYIYDHEMNDLYLIRLYCDPDETTNEESKLHLLSVGDDWQSAQCEGELDSLFHGAGWHSLNRRLPFLWKQAGD
jgi:hypothetical protein